MPSKNLSQMIKYHALCECELFKSADKKTLIKLLEGATIKEFSINDIIINQGEFTSYIGIAIRGKIAISFVLENGVSIPISTLTPPSWFNSSTFASVQNSQVTLTAQSKSSIILIEKEHIFNCITEDSNVARNVITNIANRLLWIGNLALTHIDSSLSLHEKIGLCIYNQINISIGNGEEEKEHILELTRSDIANLVGLSRKSILPHLKKYSEMGLIEFGYKKIKIKNKNEFLNYVNNELTKVYKS